MARKKVEKELEEVKPDEVSELQKKRDALVASIKPRLLTQSQLKRGGGNIRARHIQEKGYEPIVDEINELGKKLGLPLIGFGNLRKE